MVVSTRKSSVKYAIAARYLSAQSAMSCKHVESRFYRMKTCIQTDEVTEILLSEGQGCELLLSSPMVTSGSLMLLPRVSVCLVLVTAIVMAMTW